MQGDQKLTMPLTEQRLPFLFQAFKRKASHSAPLRNGREQLFMNFDRIALGDDLVNTIVETVESRTRITARTNCGESRLF
jgi:hypothetical protein